MAATRILVLVVLWGAVSGTAQAAESVEGQREVDGSTSTAAGEASGAVTATLSSGPASAVPWMSTTMPNSVQDKLRKAYALAVTWVQEVPECAGLFSSLNEDGSDALTRTLYYPADPRLEQKLCRGAAAFTFVGRSQTYVCRRYSSLTDDFAAMLLVHEALHQAGLTEKPQDRKAMTAHEINVMVTRECGF